MYSSLNLYGQSNKTVNKHYPCPSMALPTYHVQQQIPVLAVAEVELDNTKIPSVRFSESVFYEPDMPGKTRIANSKHVALLPVMDPRFNLREICKQCVLLEDHLTHEEKRCTDCCTKHFLTIEALAEEALTLDSEHILSSDVQLLPAKIRALEREWLDNPSPETCTDISQKLRKIRKTYQQNSFNMMDGKGCDSSRCLTGL